MSEHPDPKPEESEEGAEAPENKPLGFTGQYPPKPGQTEYGTYQNPHK